MGFLASERCDFFIDLFSGLMSGGIGLIIVVYIYMSFIKNDVS